jgi:hypothetical protein
MAERVPVTSVARTLLDLAEVLRPERLVRVLERAEDLRLLEAKEALAACDRSRGHRGSRRLREALAAYRPRHRVLRSNVERDFLALVEAAGLPRPATNYFVAPGYELDAYWPKSRLAVELDTFETHGSRRAFEADRERDAALLEGGITTIRVTDRQLADQPDTVLRRVRALLA